MAEVVVVPAAPSPPSFLRECGYFPFSYIDGFHDGEKAFELAVGLEVLLETTTNAAEFLFEFLKNAPPRDIVMLHDELYIAKFPYPHSISRILMDTGGHNDLYHICHRPSTTAVDVIGGVSGVMDPVLLLLAKHKSIRNIIIYAGLNSNSNEQPFPSSLAALNYFVSKAQSPRVVCLKDAGLSATQWQVVTFSCNKNIDLYFDISGTQDGKLNALMEAMNCNLCPAKLHLLSGESALSQDFLLALGSTTSLTKLTVHIACHDATIFVMLIEAVARNRDLQYLKIITGMSFDLTDDQWERICCSMASHPSIKALACEGFWNLSPRSEERDELFIQHVNKNSVLCELDVPSSFMNDWQHVKRTIHPTLEMNRFRLVLDAIKHEKDVARRRSLFATTLQSNQVSKCPAFRFLLLNHNTDLLLDGMVPGKKIQGCEHASFSSIDA